MKWKLIGRQKPHIIVGDYNVNIAQDDKISQEYPIFIYEKKYKIMNHKKYTRIDGKGKYTI